MRIVCLSDTHGLEEQLIPFPDGDVLIHAGDFSCKGEIKYLENFNAWLGTLPHPHKLVVSGNHEFFHPVRLMLMPDLTDEEKQLRAYNLKKRITNATILDNEAITINGIRFFGAKWDPKVIWDQTIPKDVQILITHQPPGTFDGHSEPLQQHVEEVKPILHVFGHIHRETQYYGVMSNKEGRISVNAAIEGEGGRPNKPIVIDVDENTLIASLVDTVKKNRP